MTDLQGKPMYMQGDCKVCKGWEEEDHKDEAAFSAKCMGAGLPITPCKKRCHTCNDVIEPATFVPYGYKSQEVDHWHVKDVKGLKGYGAQFRRLCLGCYRESWKRKYPDVPCQV